MIDDTPYIIVDNQIIPPIERSSPAQSAGDEPPAQKEQPFGVIDRVTISKQARERCRQQADLTKADSTNIEDRKQIPPLSSSPLTDSPHRRIP
jgi:hypothetical protein